nr:hypothetical protein [Mycoplasmopsis bovis]
MISNKVVDRILWKSIIKKQAILEFHYELSFKRHFLKFSQNFQTFVLSTEKKYSISIVKELILDIDTFPLSLSINWRYSLDEYWLRGQNV